MNIVVTGFDGFIGSHLTEFLQAKKYNVVGISNKLDKRFRIKQIKSDIRKISYNDISGEISCIVHLAAISDVQYCQKNPQKCFEVNVMGTQRILDIARKKNCKLIYISTSHVYGIPQKLPIKEDHPRNPTSIYSASKLGGEVCCESYSKTYGMDISILRLFSVYGPNSPHHLVISKIISQLKSKNIELGNLYPKRDFIYVSDVINAIEIVIKKSRGLDIFNIGTGKSYSILEICNIIKNITKKNMMVHSTKSLSRKADVDNVVSDSSKLRELEWSPKISIHDGLQLILHNTENPAKT